VRIVVAENDPDALELLLVDLRFEGHDIVGTAADGETAFELCRRLHPDVCILDFRMPPGPNGLATAARLRAAQPAMRVVIYSNYMQGWIRDQARAIGVRFLVKGNLQALRQAVK